MGFEENFSLVDPQFFDIFSFNFKDGNPQSAFLNPNSIVLTESMAQKNILEIKTFRGIT